MAEILTPDLCVIGAGAGGLAVVAAARAHGASVVLVERGRMGGDSLNGGVPARALAAAGQQAQAIRNGAAFGIAADGPKVNFRRLHDHVHEVVAGLAPDVSIARMEALGAEIITAEGRFTDARTLEAGETLIRARRFVIATGSHSLRPGIPGLESVPYFTTETIFGNTRKLTHLVIAGAGPQGLELAQAYSRLGTQVTVIEPGRPLPGSDPELAAIALKRMREEGVDIRPDTEIAAIQARSQGIGIVIRSAAGEEMLDASHVLVAVGRAPNLDGLAIEKAQIRRLRLDPARLEVGPDLKTSNRRVYAIGDAAGGGSAQLAEHQAQIVVRSALFGVPFRQRAQLVPTVTYTDPEIAEVGLTEAAARHRYRNDFVVTRWTFAQNARARTLHQGFGTAKLLSRRNGRIIGAGIAGPAAGELIALFSFAIANGLGVRHLARFAAAYPTLADIAHQLGLEAERREEPRPLLARLLALNRLLP